MELPLTKITLVAIYAAFCITLQAESANSLSYPVFGTKRYHRSAGRSSNIGQPPPAPPPAPPLYADTTADEYNDPYASAYMDPDPYSYQPQTDEEPIEYWPRRESHQYYGMPTYRGEYNPKPYYYSHGPSYSYYDDRSDPASNPLDDLHEEIQQEDARERQREMAGDSSGDWNRVLPAAGRGDSSRLTSTFLKNLMAYNQQMNQQNIPQPDEQQYGYELEYGLPAEVQAEVPRQKQNQNRQTNKSRKHKQPRVEKQSSFYDYGDSENTMKELALENESIYPRPIVNVKPFEEPRLSGDQDVEALKTLVSPKGPKSERNNNNKSSKKAKQRRKQQAKKEKERKDREQALEEQREQQRLAEQEQQARREMLAKQQEEERRQQQELERLQMRREQILMQQQLQGQNQPPQYSDYQQEPSGGADYFVEPEYDDSWTSWDRKRSQVAPMPSLTIDELILLDEQKLSPPIQSIPSTSSKTMKPTFMTFDGSTSNRATILRGDGQKEIMQPRPANPVRQPLAKFENRADVQSNGGTESNNDRSKSETGSVSTRGDNSVYGTIKHLMDMEQRLDKQVHEKTVQKRYVTNEESLVRQLKNLKRSVV